MEKCTKGCIFPLPKKSDIRIPKNYIILTIKVYNTLLLCGGARGVMVIVVGNGHGDTSSNPGRD